MSSPSFPVENAWHRVALHSPKYFCSLCGASVIGEYEKRTGLSAGCIEGQPAFARCGGEPLKQQISTTSNSLSSLHEIGFAVHHDPVRFCVHV